MELTRLIEALARPTAYPFPVDAVEVHQTHISAVFLAGAFAYKVKKPVSLGFLDFGTLARRRHFCEEEVRLNRRLAPKVYLGVVPITDTPAGPVVAGEGEPVEYAVMMERLPEPATMLSRLTCGELTAEQVRTVAQRLARFHAGAASGPEVAAFGGFDVVARNARENFPQSAEQVGRTVSRAVFDRLQELTELELERLRPLIEGRAERGVTRDTHGDLHLDHVYLFPDRPPPDDLVVVDCVEFNERFRFADPVADMAFLAMDLRIRGRPDLAQTFADAYFDAAGDAEGRALLRFYTAYRSVVRAKVRGMQLAEREVSEEEREVAAGRARAHWLLALAELEEPARRPCLVLVGGLPGTGKSTLSRGLGERARFGVIRNDVVRKELAGLKETESAQSEVGTGLYTPEWTDRTYDECLRRAESILFEGGRAIVDATFRQEWHRRMFLDAAVRWGVPVVLLMCRAEPSAVRSRIAARRGDASDADWAVYESVAARWEEPGPATRDGLVVVETDAGPGPALDHALAELAARGLFSSLRRTGL